MRHLIEENNKIVIHNIISGLPIEKCDQDIVRLDQDYINTSVMFIALCNQDYAPIIPSLIQGSDGEVELSNIEDTINIVLKELALNIVEGGKKGKSARSVVEKAGHFRNTLRRTNLIALCANIMEVPKTKII